MRKQVALILLFLVAFANVQANNCPKHVDGDSLKTAPIYFYYKQFYKKQDFEKAYPYWRTLYDKAPGLSSIIFYEGEEILKDKITKTKGDVILQAKYVDTLLEMYDKWVHCHGNEDFVLGTKKAQALITYKNDVKSAKAALEKSLQVSSRYPVAIQTYFNLLNYEFGAKQIDETQITKKYEELIAMLDKNIAKNDQYVNNYIETKKAIEETYLSNFANKSDPSDCFKLMEIYLKKYQAKPNDLATIEDVYIKTKGCADSTFNVELLQKLNQLDPNYSYAIRLGNIYMKSKKEAEAYTLYENALKVEKDSSKIASLYLLMANMKTDKNEFEVARSFARNALQYEPQNARAYLLIGYLYASSGKLCGPGVGFPSQIVLWPAFDNFRKAVEYGDEEVKKEANNLLATYKQYLPTHKEITAKKLKVGAPYTIKCWINEETTVQVK
jgi:tetratricopeptide (TPR) repeat protein